MSPRCVDCGVALDTPAATHDMVQVDRSSVRHELRPGDRILAMVVCVGESSVILVGEALPIYPDTEPSLRAALAGTLAPSASVTDDKARRDDDAERLAAWYVGQFASTSTGPAASR